MFKESQIQGFTAKEGLKSSTPLRFKRAGEWRVGQFRKQSPVSSGLVFQADTAGTSA
jgi:hypothetical protein